MEGDVKDAVRAQFSRNARKYVESEYHARGIDLPVMVGWLQPLPGWEALDVATGGGHMALALSPHVGRMTASDLTPAMLRAARDHLTAAGCANISYVVADAEALPFLDASFDVVTCRIAPHHFPRPDRFIQEAARVLRPGGKFLLIDNIAPEDAEQATFINKVEWLRDRSHGRCLPLSEWRALMDAAGLNEVNVNVHWKTFAFPSWVARTAESEAQMQEVETFLLGAPPELQAAFSVKVDGGRVLSFQTLESIQVAIRARKKERGPPPLPFCVATPAPTGPGVGRSQAPADRA